MDQPKSGGTQRAGPGGRPDKQDKPPPTSSTTIARKEKKEKGKSTGGAAKRNRKGKKDAPPPLTRVIIRRLPPTMTEQLFCEQISMDGKMPDHDEFYFVGPDWSLGHNASCRAYINFTNPADIFRFTDSFDGYTFVDSKGLEYQAVVEYAPFQKPQKNRSRKKDPKCGTIETDTHFVAFKEALEIEAQEALHGRGTQEFSFKLEQEEKTTTTPLLEYIAQRKQEKRDERRRKQEEKRRMRDEERFMKKTQIAKAIPDAIQEEEAFNEFMEQTARPRLNALQIASKPGGSSGKPGDGKPKDEKDKKARNRKDKKKGDESKVQPEGPGKLEGDKNAGNKKQERDKPGKKTKEKVAKDETVKPKEPNQPQKGERNEKPKKDKQPTNASSTGTAAPEQPLPPKASQNVPAAGGSAKKEVKKYSERRKETRARAETRFAEQDTRMEPEFIKDSAGSSSSPTTKADKMDGKKIILTANVAPFIPKEKMTILLAGHSSTATNLPVDLASLSISAHEKPSAKNGKKSPSPDGRNKSAANEKLTEKQREAREARKIRNKDRPSIEIYQPRKRIVSGAGGKSEDDRGRSDSDRPSDNVSASASAGAAAESGGGDGATKERRHKLTKKASDQRQKGKNARKNSIESEGGAKAEQNASGTWWM